MKRLAMWQMVGVLALAWLLVGQPAGAQTGQQAPTVKREAAQNFSVDGGELYQAYCAVCHGKDGKGNGPALSALKTPPSDLTTLAQRHGGKFDSIAVENMIVGQERFLAAHGSKDMPIWGPVFKDISRDDAMATLRVTNLVKHIESMQVK